MGRSDSGDYINNCVCRVCNHDLATYVDIYVKLYAQANYGCGQLPRHSINNDNIIK